MWVIFLREVGLVTLNTWRSNNVVITSKRRHFDVIKSEWLRCDVITTSLLRDISGFVKFLKLSSFFQMWCGSSVILKVEKDANWLLNSTRHWDSRTRSIHYKLPKQREGPRKLTTRRNQVGRLWEEYGTQLKHNNWKRRGSSAQWLLTPSVIPKSQAISTGIADIIFIALNLFRTETLHWYGKTLDNNIFWKKKIRLKWWLP